MGEFEANRRQNRAPPHPRNLLSDVFEGSGLTNKEIARRPLIYRQHLLDVLAERKLLSANVAVRIGKFPVAGDKQDESRRRGRGCLSL